MPHHDSSCATRNPAIGDGGYPTSDGGVPARQIMPDAPALLSAGATGHRGGAGAAVRLAAAIALREGMVAQDRRTRTALRRVTARTQALADIADAMERADRGGVSPDSRALNCLSAVLATVAEECSAEDRGIEIVVGASGRCGDECLVSLLLVAHELVANAVRHAFHGAPGGRVEVDARATGGWMELRVSDTGTGLEPGCIPSTGGLRLCEGVARRAGGTLVVESRFDGLAATLRLPC